MLLSTVALAVALSQTRIPTAQSQCLPDSAHVCLDEVTGEPRQVTDDEYANHSAQEQCIQCSAKDCNIAKPPTNVSCLPYQRFCTMCGTPDTTMISSGYTLRIQSVCGTRQRCSGNVTFERPTVFAGYDSLAVETSTATLSGKIIARQCPLFV